MWCWVSPALGGGGISLMVTGGALIEVLSHPLSVREGLEVPMSICSKVALVAQNQEIYVQFHIWWTWE